MEEIFRDVENYKGYYQVSNFGNVKSKRNNSSSGYCGERLLKQGRSGSGYSFVNLSKNGKAKIFQTHRLVANTFIRKMVNNEQVNHKDFNENNNKLDNLEIVTPSQNTIHLVNSGRANTARGEQKKNSRFRNIDVIDIKQRLRDGQTGYSIAKSYNVNKVLIYDIKRGRTWKHITL